MLVIIQQSKKRKKRITAQHDEDQRNQLAIVTFREQCCCQCRYATCRGEQHSQTCLSYSEDIYHCLIGLSQQSPLFRSNQSGSHDYSRRSQQSPLEVGEAHYRRDNSKGPRKYEWERQIKLSAATLELSFPIVDQLLLTTTKVTFVLLFPAFFPPPIVPACTSWTQNAVKVVLTES